MATGGVQHGQSEGAVAGSARLRQGQAHVWGSLSLKDERGQIPKLPVVFNAAVLIDVKSRLEFEASVLAERQVLLEGREHRVGGHVQNDSFCVDTSPRRSCGDGFHGDLDGACIACVQRDAGSCARRLESISLVHSPGVFKGGLLTKECGQARSRHFELHLSLGAQHVRERQCKFSHRRHGHRECQRRTHAHERFSGHVVGCGQGKLDVGGVKAIDCWESGGGG